MFVSLFASGHYHIQLFPLIWPERATTLHKLMSKLAQGWDLSWKQQSTRQLWQACLHVIHSSFIRSINWERLRLHHRPLPQIWGLKGRAQSSDTGPIRRSLCRICKNEVLRNVDAKSMDSNAAVAGFLASVWGPKGRPRAQMLCMIRWITQTFAKIRFSKLLMPNRWILIFAKADVLASIWDPTGRPRAQIVNVIR